MCHLKRRRKKMTQWFSGAFFLHSFSFIISIYLMVHTISKFDKQRIALQNTHTHNTLLCLIAAINCHSNACESIRSLISRVSGKASIAFELTFANLTVSIAFVQNYWVTSLFRNSLRYARNLFFLIPPGRRYTCIPWHCKIYQFWFDINTNRLCDSAWI